MPKELSKSLFLHPCSLHPHLYPFIFNLDKANVSDRQTAQAAPVGWLLPTVRNEALEAISFPISFHMGSPSASEAMPQPWPPGPSLLGAQHTRAHCPP